MTLSDHGWNAIMTMMTLAAHEGDQALRLKDIRASLKLSRPSMERILAKLRHAGLVEGIRGTGGGYYLNKEPHEITLAEIVSAAEEHDHHLQWLNAEQATPEQQLTQQVWNELDGRLNAFLTDITLGSLLKLDRPKPVYRPSKTANLIAKMFPATPQTDEDGLVAF